MRTVSVSRRIAILSGVFVGVLATGSFISIGDPVLIEMALPSRLSATLALVSSPVKLSSIQPLEPLHSRQLGTIGLPSSVITSIPSAREMVQMEHERILAERDAFKQFRDRVARLDPSSTVSKTPSPSQELSPPINRHSSSSTAEELDDIQQAYRDTVMNTPHYDEEYGESLVQDMTIEFGEDLTAAIMTNSQLTPSLQQAIVQAATAASARRTTFSNQLDEEEATLKDAYQTLAPIGKQYEQSTDQPLQQQSIDDLWEAHQQLTTCISPCEQLVEERQTQRTDGHTALPHTDETVDLQEYLYQSLDVTYPLLADGTAVLERCLTARVVGLKRSSRDACN